jgi:hypothetical protein
MSLASGLTSVPDGEEVLADLERWADAEASPSPAGPDDGTPFYKPAYFAEYGNIGDELLRRNATNGSRYVVGKVRRQLKNPPRREGKRPVYWYSQPDVRKCWPERFTDGYDAGADI